MADLTEAGPGSGVASAEGAVPTEGGGADVRGGGRRGAAVAWLLSRERLLLLAIFFLAFGVRLAWIAYADPDPADGRFDDTVFYDRAAQALADGRGFIGFADQPTAQWPPGYPLLLAGVYKAIGHSVLAAKVLNALAGAVTCLLVYCIGARVFSRRVGLLGALAMALFPGQVYFSTLLLTEAVSAALIALLLLLTLMWTIEREPSRPRLLGLGILFGVAALTRSEAVVLAAAVVVLWKLMVPSWRKFAGWAAILGLGAALAVLPWTVRNAITMNAFIPISSGVGHTFLAGHQSDPYGDDVPEEPEVSPEEEQKQLLEWLNTLTPEELAMWEGIAEEKSAECVSPAELRHRLSVLFPEKKISEKYSYLPYPEREIRVEREALREGLEFMVENPGYELKLLWQKFYHLYEGDSEALEWIRHYAPPPSPGGAAERAEVMSHGAAEDWAALADNYYYVAVIWVLGGIPLWFSLRDKKRLLLVLFVLSWTLVHLAFVPGARYHAPLIPIFCLWAAVPLVGIWGALRRRPAGEPGRSSDVGGSGAPFDGATEEGSH